jgi:hypothetical protein
MISWPASRMVILGVMAIGGVSACSSCKRSTPKATEEQCEVKPKAACRKANFEHANLQDVDMHEADLREALLSGADLSGANLDRANLAGAELPAARLERANLRGADLRHADLPNTWAERADFRGADLREATIGTSFAGADFADARFEGAQRYDCNNWPGNCLITEIHGPVARCPDGTTDTAEGCVGHMFRAGHKDEYEQAQRKYFTGDLPDGGYVPFDRGLPHSKEGPPPMEHKRQRDRDSWDKEPWW